MKQELTGWERFKAIIAKWIVLNISARISPLAVLSLCLETASLYHENIEVAENETI